MNNPLTKHLRDTDNPQSYIVHFKFAFVNSGKVMLAGLAGIIHAFFPWWFPFTTSTCVISSFKKAVDSRRHLAELQEIMPKGYLLDKHLKKK